MILRSVTATADTSGTHRPSRLSALTWAAPLVAPPERSTHQDCNHGGVPEFDEAMRDFVRDRNNVDGSDKRPFVKGRY